MRRPSHAAALALAACAVVGLGAAVTATAAAWTNDAWFRGSTKAVSVNLQGSTDGTNFVAADTDAASSALNISSTLINLQPNTVKGPITVYIKNAGASPLVVSTVTPVKSGALFTGVCTLAVATTPLTSSTLAVGATATMTVTVTVPDLPLSCQTKTGQLVLQFNGTA